jgi:hypothetical protein
MTDRRCFPCTACCEGWLITEVNGLKIEPGTPCINCTKQGCKIYEKRPENPCVSFMCGWLREPDKIAEHMKPSECGAIVTLSMRSGRQILNATPVGKTIPSDTLDWLKAYSREQSLPLMFSEYLFKDGKYLGVRKFGYGPPSFIHADTRIMPEDTF